MKSTTFSQLLERPGPVLLDGGVGSELARRGIRTSMPLWSAHALFDDKGLQTLTTIHEDYARAGAEVLVANTFRTSRHTLRKAGREEDWRLVNARAVDCARAAAAISTHPCLVAGAIAPLEDCYRPDLVPLQTACEGEHCRQVELLAELGVDLILIETMNCSREALAALVAARDCGIDALLSLCPRPPHHLLSGEPLEELLPSLISHAGPTLRGVLLNCAPRNVLDQVYPRFASLVAALPHGLYAHIGEPEETTGWKFSDQDNPEEYARWIATYFDNGARFVGGCCGTTPAHIAAIARILQRPAVG